MVPVLKAWDLFSECKHDSCKSCGMWLPVNEILKFTDIRILCENNREESFAPFGCHICLLRRANGDSKAKNLGCLKDKIR
jgi:hypothetical protein